MFARPARSGAGALSWAARMLIVHALALAPGAACVAAGVGLLAGAHGAAGILLSCTWCAAAGTGRALTRAARRRMREAQAPGAADES